MIAVCPTLSIVQKWFRKIKNIDICIYDYDLCDKTDKYLSVIRNRNQEYIIDMILNNIPEANIRYPWDKEFDSYEEALKSGIDKALTLI